MMTTCKIFKGSVEDIDKIEERIDDFVKLSKQVTTSQSVYTDSLGRTMIVITVTKTN